ncbi:hypothetical protein IIA79_07005 [bacterium]|nr:hypothetical protein [bacterium]
MALACLFLVNGCPSKGSPASSPGSAASGGSARANPAAPGIDFIKVTVGLRSRTLDFIGARGFSVAGAKGAGLIFFGIEKSGNTDVYSRDLATGERAKVAAVRDMIPGTLGVDAGGSYLVYCRSRPAENYIDDPYKQHPGSLSLPYRYDLAKGKEEALFDFRKQSWQQYRGAEHSPVLSPDGRRVAVLAYNMDSAILSAQVGEWIMLEDFHRELLDEMPEEERISNVEAMRQLITAPHVASRLREKGVEPALAGPVSEEEREAMREIFDEVSETDAALLIWEADGEKVGSARILRLDLEEGFGKVPHAIQAVGNEKIIIGVREELEDPTTPYHFFNVDLESGELTDIGSYQGAPAYIALDEAEANLLVVYKPADPGDGETPAETCVRTIPLEGSGVAPASLPANMARHEDVFLGADYLRLLDVTTDGTHLVGQDRADSDLYLVDLASGERTLLATLFGTINGIFLPDDPAHTVYLQDNILYQIDIVDDPEHSGEWTGEDYFVKYRDEAVSFLERFGFLIPANIEMQWKERRGLGVHEASAVIVNPDMPGASVLLSYSVDKGEVVSAWFPRGYPFEMDDGYLEGELDAYDIEKQAGLVLDRLGWLSPARQAYQPGANPLYDGKSDSYVVILREGYMLGEDYVFSAEATLRIRAYDGEIVEMSLNELDPVYNQPFEATQEKAELAMRNEGEQPIPPDAPIEFNWDTRRRIVVEVTSTGQGPAEYRLPGANRIAYEIDGFLQPENDLLFTFLIDTETAEVLGQLDYLPSGQVPRLAGASAVAGFGS